MRKLIYQSMIVTVIRVVSGLSTFILYILFSHFLSPETLGSYELTLTLIMFVSNFFSLGFVQYACGEFTRSDLLETSKLINKINSTYLIYSFIVTIICSAVILLDFTGLDLKKIECFLIIGCAFLFYYRNLFLGILQQTFCPIRYSLLECLYPVCVFLLMLLYFETTKEYSLTIMLLINILSLLLIVMFFVFKKNHKFELWQKITYAEFKKIITISIAWFFVAVLNWFMYSLDKWILKFFCGIYAVGLYSQIYKLASAYNLVVVSLITIVFTPYIYVSFKDDIPIVTWNKIKKQATYLILFTFILLILDLVIGKKVYRLLIGEKYWPAFRYNYLIIINFMLTAIIGYFNYVFAFTNKTKHIQWSLLMGCGLNIFIGVLITPKLGIYGIIISSVVSQLFILAYIYITTKRVFLKHIIS